MPSKNSDELLLSPFDLRDLKLKNRVVLAPMTRARADAHRRATPLMASYYRQRSGAGLIITEACTVSAQGNGWVNSPGMYTNDQADSWLPVLRAIHGEGSRVFLQLWHTGRASHSDFHDGELPVAPSAIALGGENFAHTPRGKKPFEVPRALETKEIPLVVESYLRAAERAKDLGFDGVEVHSANGYLLDEFLQSRTNHRGDAYGGSLENRFRLLREILEAVCPLFPQRVAVRLSPNGVFNDMGSPDYRETFLHAARELDAFDLAYLHVMDGLAFGFHELGPAMTLEEFREVFHGPLVGNCGYDQAKAEGAIARGAADCIAFGRPYLSNPDLVERFRHGWPLAPESDPSTWYSGGGAVGYTDFPPYEDNGEG